MRKAIAILILSGIVFIASACGAASGQADEGTESFIEAESPEKEETDAGEISAVPEASADRNEVSESHSHIDTVRDSFYRICMRGSFYST